MTGDWMFWLLFGLMAAAVVAVLVVPLIRRPRGGGDRAAYDLEVYRHQLAELDNDVERGVMTAEQASAARLEIERRVLRAGSEKGEEGPPSRQWGTATALVLVIAVPAAAAALYATLGRPDLPGRPLAARAQPGGPHGGDRLAAGRLEDAVKTLMARLEQTPDDFPGWVLLGRTRRSLQDMEGSAAAFRRALALDDSSPGLHAELAEVLVFLADGQVTPEAVAAFDAALERDPENAPSRYYLASSKAQAGDWQGAFDDWLVLAWESPPEAPWMPAVEARLGEAASQLGIDLAGVMPPKRTARTAPPKKPAAARPPPEGSGPSAEDMAAAAQMTAEERAKMIAGMIDRLAERLEKEPEDFDGWARLGRAYSVQGRVREARNAYARAAALRAADIPQQMRLASAVIETMQDGEKLPAEAVDIFDRILTTDTDHRIALWYSGVAAAQAGREDEARAKWEKLIKQLDPQSRDYATVRSRLDALR